MPEPEPETDYKVKNIVHFLAPLSLWVICLAIYILTITNDIPHKVDSIKTFQLQKKPKSFQDAWSSVQDSFSTYWPSDTCYAKTALTGDATCQGQRTNLVSQITTLLNCDKYDSQMCSCVAQITNGILPKTTIANGTTTVTGKALGGYNGVIQYSIESCRWLMHNANTAVYSNKVWAQRTAIVLLISTLVTANAFDWVFLNAFLRYSQDIMTRAVIKSVVNFLWGMIVFAICVPSEPNSYAFFMLILFPPVVAMGLYESLHTSLNFPVRPFIHPYFFTTILGALTLLAMVESGVSDFDVIVFEILKCNIVCYLYLQIVWKYMIRDTYSFAKSPYVETGTLRAVIMTGVLYFAGLMAPYATTTTGGYNLMWYTPMLWVILAYTSVLWISWLNFDDMYGKEFRESDAGRKAIRDREREKSDLDLSPASRHVSTLVILFVFVIVLYYLRENSTVFRVLIDKFPEVTIQNNATQAWQRAPALVTYY